MNKLGIYYAYWENNWAADYRYYIKKAKNLGLDIIEVALGGMADMPKSELDEMKSLSRDLDIEITYGIGLPKEYDMSSLNEDVRKNGVSYVKKLIEIVNYMDGQIIGGCTYSYWPGSLPQGVFDKRPYFDKAVISAKEIMGLAEDTGVIFCYEVLNRFEQFLLNTAKEGIEFVEAVNSPNAKILLDTFHMNIEEDSISDAIRLVGDHLGHVHIGEANRKVPGMGHMPWDDFARGLKDINYNGRLVMEPFVKKDPGEVSRDIRIFRDLIDDVSEERLDRDVLDAIDFIKGKLL